jgi:hypothetical protein
MQKSRLQHLIQEDPGLVWYTGNKRRLSDSSIFEHVLNYGTWDQVQQSLALLGLKEASDLYADLKNRPRSNLKSRVRHYFDLYFDKHAH